MKIGIDKIGFFAPNLYVDLKDLAEARGIDPNKFLIGLGQSEMAICPETQDSISLAANAAYNILTEEDINDIDLLIFATESGVDLSKSGASFIHGLLNLKSNVRSIEMKHACYSATFAVQTAKAHIALNPTKKALVLASDLAIYGLNNSAEPTQGAGAIALLISKNPKLVEIEDDSAFLTTDVLDFWKPIYSDVALVDGHFSNQKYQESFIEVYQAYLEKTNRIINDFKAICLHTPYSKIGYKTLKMITNEDAHPELFNNYQLATTLNRRVGNIYTGALYLSLLSLLERANLKYGDRIGLYSYGSGAVAEFFSVIVSKDYEKHLNKDKNDHMLNNRMKLSIKEYEELLLKKIDGTDITFNQMDTKDNAYFYFKGISNHQRLYEKKHNFE